MEAVDGRTPLSPAELEAALALAATVAALMPVLRRTEQLKTSIMVDTFLDYAFIYDGGLKRHWIVYNIASIKAADLEILAQQCGGSAFRAVQTPR